MSTREDRLTAGRAVFAKVVSEEVARETKAVRSQVEPTLAPGEKVKAQLPDGTVVGVVQLTEQAESVVVVDEPALLEFVRRTRPDELVTRVSVRESYLTHLKGMAKAQLREHGEVFDPVTGEEVPGLALTYGTPSFRVSPTEPGRAAIRAAWTELLGGASIFPALTERGGADG